MLGLFWPDESSRRRWCNESAAGKMELPSGAKESHRHSAMRAIQSAEEPHIEGVLKSTTTCYKVLRSTTKCQRAVHRLSIAYKELQSTAKYCKVSSRWKERGDHDGGQDSSSG